jgi:hypothetical protein
LPRGGSPANTAPTAAELCRATQNYVYRNLLSEFMAEEKKLSEYLIYKADLWPLGYNMGILEGVCQEIRSLPVIYAVEFMTVLERFVNK